MKTINFSVVALSFLLLCAESATACWCRREALDTEKKFRTAVAKELKQSALVFAGEAVERNASGLRFRVKSVWKGKATNEIVFSHEGESSEDGREIFINSCAFLFEVGKTYLVYADRVGGELFVSECSRTQLLEGSERDLGELDRLRPNRRVLSSHAEAADRLPSTSKSNKRLQLTRCHDVSKVS